MSFHGKKGILASSHPYYYNIAAGKSAKKEYKQTAGEVFHLPQNHFPMN